MPDKILTVDEMTVKIREAVCSAKDLQNITVRGELLGFKRHSSGHAYFTVVGAETRVACVLFRSNASSIIMWPKDGDEVLVSGRVDVYGARGSYQIYAVKLLPLGEGAKARAKEFLKNRLMQEGLFDPEIKKRLPIFPSRVAVITSPTGAAVQDVIKIAS
ncbi:MAG: exodeoxyribonuclease VII large subunit, partial [Synergistaceae bacterium]